MADLGSGVGRLLGPYSARRRYDKLNRVTDAWEPERDYRPAVTLARFQFLLGLSVTERPTRPTFLPGSFFLRPGGH